MTIEAAQTINELNTSYPRSTDLMREGDDHIRMIKATIQRTFPRITGTVNISSGKLNAFDSASTIASSGIELSVPLTVHGAFAAQKTDINGDLGVGGLITVQDAHVTQATIAGTTFGANHQINTPNDAVFNVNKVVSKDIQTNGFTCKDNSAIVQNSVPQQGGVGAWLSSPAHTCRLTGRGAYGDTNGAIFDMFAQEHVGTVFRGVVRINGFSDESVWAFNQGGVLETPGALHVGSRGGNSTFAGNITVAWGGRSATYQENGDIVGGTIFGAGSNTLSGCLNRAYSMIDLFMGAHQSTHYGQQQINWAIPSGGALTGIHQSPFYKDDTWVEDVYWRNLWKNNNGTNQVIGMQ